VKLCDLEKYLKLKPPNLPIGNSWQKLFSILTFLEPLKNPRKNFTSNPFSLGNINPKSYIKIFTKLASKVLAIFYRLQFL